MRLDVFGAFATREIIILNLDMYRALISKVSQIKTIRI